MGPEILSKIYARIVKLNQTDADDEQVVKIATAKFAKTSDEFGRVLLTYAPEVRRIIAAHADQRARVLELFKVTVCLDGEAKETGLEPGYYAGLIMLWNEWFSESCYSFKKPPMQLTSMVQLVRWILSVRWDEEPSFKAFCHGGSAAATRLLALQKKVTDLGLQLADIQNCAHFLHQHLLNIDTLADTTIQSLNHLRIAAPPASDAIVFQRWGSGDARGSGDLSALNCKNHFLKHVLNAHPDPAVKLDWPDECTLWWKFLNIQVPGLSKQPADGMTFVTEKRLSNWVGEQALKDQLVTLYEPAYKKYVLDLCTKLIDVVVHTDATGGNIKVKGVYPTPEGNRVFFVGGRLDGTEVTISTCFIPNNEGMAKIADFDGKYKVWKVSK